MVSATATLSNGMSIAPSPMLRRNGTGIAMSTASETATVRPLISTLWPAARMDRSIACSLG